MFVTENRDSDLGEHGVRGSFLSEIKQLNITLNDLRDRCINLPVNDEIMSQVSNLENNASGFRDAIFAKYNQSDAWSQNYLSGKSAIEHETHRSRGSIAKAIERGKLLQKYDGLYQALSDNLITTDHLDLMVKTNQEKYSKLFDRDIDIITQAAITLNITHFKNLLTHFKSKADDELEINDNVELFEERHLEISQLYDGNWYLNAILDNATGMHVNKILNEGADYLWRNDNDDARKNTTRTQYRADWLSVVFKGYENAGYNSHKTKNNITEHNFIPGKTCDLIVDIELLNNNISTRSHLKNMLSKNSPIRRTHSRTFIEQLLCDCNINLPIKNLDGSYRIGTSARVASAKQKRELALQNDTCTIIGCSMPAVWCDAHHIKHWAHGGQTQIDNLVLLCTRHHNQIHNDKQFAEMASLQISETKQKYKNAATKVTKIAITNNSPP